MAYAAMISLKLTLQQILIHPYIFLRHREKKHIESFHERLEFLQRFLEEHPSHASDENETFLGRRIRDAAYEAEDSMDLHLDHLCNSEEMIWQMEIEPVMKQVDSLVGEVTQIEGQMAGLEIKGRRIKTCKEPPNALCEDSSSSKKNLMVGFDEYLMQIKDQLTGQSSALEVISIVGMGGIGKSTLAMHAYNDPYVLHQFDIRAWVTISQSYSIRDIMSSILDSMNKSSKGDQLGLDVYQNLKGRRYLMVIDDIWDTSAWDDLKMMFPDDETGSRIVLTTRIADVAAYASPSGTLHQIGLLNNDHSWELLCAKVFGDDTCPLNLQEIGKTIAQNCGGLPLSIVVIGGLLSKLEMTQEVWQSVAENVTSFVFSSDDRCSAILRLSYNYLPQYLKACFLYIGIFPKNQELSVSKLTMMWVAEGFLGQAHGRSLEELAERCVDDLLDRSLILKSRKNSEGKIKAFRIHDLLLDFCIEEAKHEKFLQIIGSPAYLFSTTPASERRVSIHKEFRRCRFNIDSMLSTSYVRSLVSLGQWPPSPDLFLRFKLLKVLHATDVVFSQFPCQVMELLNLRYIALACNGDIPASITKLWNLQTLIMVPDINLCGENYLPVEIWIMSHLRYVRCYGANFLDPTAARFDIYRKCVVLEDLQTLSGLWNFKFTEEMLQRIPNIKNIDISYDRRCLMEKEWSYYQLENLGNLHQLKALKIRVVPDPSCSVKSMFTVHFPASLKTLTLGGVRIPWQELAIIGSLPNLEVLKLKDNACVGTEWEPNEDEFCQLKVLVLEGLELKHWIAESDHFPSLQRLIIRWCYCLVEIPSGFGESMTLTTIGLDECDDSVWDSAHEIREIQLSYGNDDFQVINVYSAERHSKRMFFEAFRIMKDAADDSESSQTDEDEDEDEDEDGTIP
ncbi:putative late blight resistance protein homolog R1A-10 [Primulina eburnea]|uniref:putative late blight resistance protein homolog R1A-10 n=1 Tax=Primulina eburnea TaxID=1245227 RepID=UPI003C6C1124